jgi:hypothetical protein
MVHLDPSWLWFHRWSDLAASRCDPHNFSLAERAGAVRELFQRQRWMLGICAVETEVNMKLVELVGGALDGWCIPLRYCNTTSVGLTNADTGRRYLYRERDQVTFVFVGVDHEEEHVHAHPASSRGSSIPQTGS